jgi:very-short-patch-repair endonuclease
MTIERAKQLRRNMTDPERKLWYELRRSNLGGARFRRQAPIGPYVVDFVSFQHRLVIELDGATHVDAVKYDEKRAGYLAGHGYRVVRFWNNDVMANIESVLSEIARHLG